jgi:hypothetical protein
MDKRAERARLSSFRGYLRHLAAGYGSCSTTNRRNFLLPGQGDEMKIRLGSKPAVLSAAVDAAAFAVVGLSLLGWTLRRAEAC